MSQTAQETVRPATVVLRTSLALIVVVLMFVLAFPTVSLGTVNWNDITQRESDPVACLATHLPYIGFLAGPMAAILAATIVLISANTGVMSSSRLAYSMAKLGLIINWLSHVHPQFRTPIRSVLFFSGVAAAQAIFALFSSRKALETIGAMLAYFLSKTALYCPSIKEPHTPRP